MSTKINIYGIISGHLDTLRDGRTRQLSRRSLLIFYGLPAAIALAGALSGLTLNNQLASLWVSFSALFGPLLIYIFIRLYREDSQLESKKSALDAQNLLNDTALNMPYFAKKKGGLRQLFNNIFYCIIGYLVLVVVAGADSAIQTAFFTPFFVFISLSLALTIMMIAKRSHALLVSF